MDFFNDDPPGPSRRFRVRFGAIGEAWGLFKECWPTWVVAGLMVTVANGALLGTLHSVFRLRLPEGGGGFRIPVPPASDLVPAVIVMVVDGVLLGGLFRLACLQVRGRRVTVADLFGVTDVLGELALGSAMLGVALTVAGTFCAVLPAFILAGVWMFTIPLIVDARVRALDAFGLSWHALKGQWLSATLFHLAASFVAGLGLCCGFLGLFLTMPLYCLSIAVLYRDAFAEKGAGAHRKPTQPDPDF